MPEDKKDFTVDTTENELNLKVRNQDNSQVYFRIKKTTQLRKLMEAYCKRTGVERSSVRFLYDGQRINDEQTPKELQLSNEDTIDAVLEQVGGNC